MCKYYKRGNKWVTWLVCLKMVLSEKRNVETLIIPSQRFNKGDYTSQFKMKTHKGGLLGKKPLNKDICCKYVITVFDSFTACTFGIQGKYFIFFTDATDIQ